MNQPSMYWSLCYECSEPVSIQEAKVVREVFIYCDQCYDSLDEADNE